jgi:hypothetical protein
MRYEERPTQDATDQSIARACLTGFQSIAIAIRFGAAGSTFGIGLGPFLGGHVWTLRNGVASAVRGHGANRARRSVSRRASL